MKQEKYQIWETVFTKNLKTGIVNSEGKSRIIFSDVTWRKALEVLHKKIDEKFSEKIVSRHVTVYSKEGRYYVVEKINLIVRNPSLNKS
jgi:hypothetical protein